MNADRKKCLFLVTALVFSGIVYLGVKQTNFKKNNFYVDNVSEKNTPLESEDNRNVKMGTKQSEEDISSDNTDYTWKSIDGKASIERVIVEDGEISIQLKNQTEENVLLFAHLEYVRRENGKEFLPIRLDFEGLELQAGKSEKLTWDPQKPLGNTGSIKIKELVFQDDKDNYKSE